MIVTYGNAEVIEALVREVAALPPIAEVVVVDHGDDGSADRAEAAGARVLRDPTNPGFGAGQNRGRDATAAPYLLLLNPDAEPVPGAIESGLEYLEAHPGVAAVQGVIENTVTGLPERSAGDELTWMHLLGRAIGARPLLGIGWVTSLAARMGTFRDHVRRVPEEPEPVEVLAGTAVLARRVALDAVGGFDEDYFLYGEDLDLCHRLRQAGWTLTALPEPWARHRSGASSGSWWGRELRWWEGTMGFAARTWTTAAFSGALGAAALQWVRMLVVRPAGWREAGRSLLAGPVKIRRARGPGGAAPLR